MAEEFNAQALVDGCRSAWRTGKMRSYEGRIAQLYNLRRMISENKQAFIDAMKEDLRKPVFEAVTFELDFSYNECAYVINELDQWMKPEKVSTPLIGVTKKCFVQRDPLGVVLIIGAWNYPFQLIVHPLIGAIAAGNAAVLKPSEVSPATSKLFQKLIPQYLDNSCFKVVTGGVAETTSLLEQRFDHIMYTGSGRVGKIVQTAAAKHLTPVTLELGGKSPLFIDSNCNIDAAVHRATSAHFYNAGQTCIAPDYIICHPDITDRVVKTIKSALYEFFGENPKESPDYARMVNERQFKRICSLLDGSEIAVGGQTDQSELYVAPTVVVNVKKTDAIMEEEIFGPIWPIINMETVDEAIDFINSREKPLAMYIFSDDRGVIDRFRNETSSGSICGNECFLQGGIETLPFGGVGGSGMGCYHGRFSYETFSHRKACVIDPIYSVSEIGRRLMYPPFSERKTSILAWALRKNIRNRTLRRLMQIGGFIVVMAVIYKIWLG